MTYNVKEKTKVYYQLAEVIANTPSYVIHMGADGMTNAFMQQPFTRYLLAGEGHEIYAHSAAKLTELTNFAFDEQAYDEHPFHLTIGEQERVIVANNYVKRQTLAHIAAWQAIANNANLKEDEFVLVMQDDLLLEADWPKYLQLTFHLTRQVSKELSKVDVEQVSLVNLLVNQAQRYSALENEYNEFFTHDHVVYDDFITNLRLVDFKQSGLFAYFIKKSAAQEILARLEAQSNALKPAPKKAKGKKAQSEQQAAAQAHKTISQPLANIRHYLGEDLTHRIVQCLPSIGRAFDPELAYKSNQECIDYLDTTDHSKLHYSEDRNHLNSIIRATTLAEHNDHDATLETHKYVVYEEGKEAELGLFFSRNGTSAYDFEPLMIPNPDRLTKEELAAYYQPIAYNPLKFERIARVLDIEEWKQAYIFTEIARRSKDNKAFLPNDWLVIVRANQELAPNWRQRLSYMIKANNGINPLNSNELNFLMLGHPSLNYLDFPSLDDLRQMYNLNVSSHSQINADPEYHRLPGQAKRFSQLLFNNLELTFPPFFALRSHVLDPLRKERRPDKYTSSYFYGYAGIILPALSQEQETSTLDSALVEARISLEATVQASKTKYAAKPAVTFPSFEQAAKYEKDRLKKVAKQITKVRGTPLTSEEKAEFKAKEQTLNKLSPEQQEQFALRSPLAKVAPVDSSPLNTLPYKPGINPEGIKTRVAASIEQAKAGVRDHLRGIRKYVINMDKNPERLDYFYNQPNTAEFTRFSAIAGANLTPEELAANFDQEKFKERFGRYASPGEIGCTLSHRAIMLEALHDPNIGENEFILIAEDDVQLAPDWYEVVNKLLESLSLYPSQGIALSNLLYLSQLKYLDDKESLNTDYIYTRQTMLRQVGSLSETSREALELGRITPPQNNGRAKLIQMSIFNPGGSAFYLIRKRTIIENAELLESPAFWYADSFNYYSAFPTYNTLTYLSPVFSRQNDGLPSLIEIERNAAERQMRVDRRHSYDAMSGRCINLKNFYVRQRTLSLEEIAQKFPNWNVIPRPSLSNYNEQALAQEVDIPALSEHLGRAPTDDEILDIIQMRDFIFTSSRSLAQSLDILLTVEDDIEISDDFFERVNNGILWINHCSSTLCYYGVVGARNLEIDKHYDLETLSALTNYKFDEEFSFRRDDEKNVYALFNHQHVLPDTSAFWLFRHSYKYNAISEPSRLPANYLENYCTPAEEYEKIFHNPPIAGYKGQSEE
ncbi:glycosyltransferase family 25 protein [Psittacicella hinzii]|uniref:Glycosyl transferase family 25 domain-containing protein n=1 Tax=Psittacicella hinzii TaxID=2028575 RepID=A0A3A1YKW5_9GAMM|nr:glycosyltransferase family 25 protein [Psittacicella hinzii]RIY38822.1 hypothetical protein CKF58_03335 [Psittacicella hinzii]